MEVAMTGGDMSTTMAATVPDAASTEMMSSTTMAATVPDAASTGTTDVATFLQTVAKFVVKPEKLENVAWPDWKFSFVNWMTIMDNRYGPLMELAETMESVPTQTDGDLPISELALYAILASVLVGRDQRILRAVMNHNGWEGWRRIVMEY